MNKRDGVALVVIALSLAVLMSKGGGSILPDLTPVDSPFPGDGFYLLVAAEANDLSGAELAANAASIRGEPGLIRQVLDYSRIDSDRPALPSPWQDALKWAREKSAGKPYYVARHGGKGSHGSLSGSASEQLATLTKALAEVR